jgi:hypothetical protein
MSTTATTANRAAAPAAMPRSGDPSGSCVRICATMAVLNPARTLSTVIFDAILLRRSSIPRLPLGVNTTTIATDGHAAAYGDDRRERCGRSPASREPALPTQARDLAVMQGDRRVGLGMLGEEPVDGRLVADEQQGVVPGSAQRRQLVADRSLGVADQIPGHVTRR